MKALDLVVAAAVVAVVVAVVDPLLPATSVAWAVASVLLMLVAVALVALAVASAAAAAALVVQPVVMGAVQVATPVVEAATVAAMATHLDPLDLAPSLPGGKRSICRTNIPGQFSGMTDFFCLAFSCILVTIRLSGHQLSERQQP